MSDSESKRVTINKSKSKRVNFNAYYTDDSESKSVHEVNRIKVKDTKDE